MIVTSVDGQWAAIQRGRTVSLLERGAGAPVGMMETAGADLDLALVGPPDVLAVVARGATPRVTLHQPPYLDTVARLELDEPMRLAAATGPRFALISAGGKQVVIVRVAGRALSSQAIDTGSPAEFVVGLERNQFLLGLLRKLEVWDAVSGRPLLRLQLQLPPPPRTVGTAQGHLWATRPGTDEVFVYRLSDGRLFQHYAGSPVEAVICHPASPLLVLVTKAGLARLHCFAHTLAPLEAPWTPGTSLAQLVTGDDITLLGLDASAAEPWRAPIAGAGAPAFAADAGAASTGAGAGGERARPADAAGAGGAAAADAAGAGGAAAAATGAGAAATAAIGLDPAAAAAPPPAPASVSIPPTSMLMTLGARTVPPPLPVTAVPVRPRAWREPLVLVGAELARGADAELPVLAVDNELGELAHRLHLSATARRTLIALYALYLAGAPRVSIARLAKITGDWGEPLGQGELAAFAMLRRRDGLVSLRRPASDLLDGAVPREVRLVEAVDPSSPAAAGRAAWPGAYRIARDGKSDAEIEAELADRLGRIAVVEGDPDRGLLEACLHGATAVSFQLPAGRPRPWPRDAGLVLVLYGSPTSWVADLPALGDVAG